jgi:protein-L-isoaspartate(D-aspartate) O-methyltransferase
MNDDLSWNRQRLVAEIEADARRTADLTGRAVFSERVLRAIGTVPRETFVPESARRNAYANRPLSIGHGQTISQPYIVALMTDLLDLNSGDRVLEIGTGCGYQTAILAELAAHVFTIEVVPELQAESRERLKALGYRNISFRIGDGWHGWPEEAPFDAIVVTAAPATLPPALTAQLAIGGRLLVPVGRQHETQLLTRILRREDGRLVEERSLPVAFVPLVKTE